MSNNNNQQEIDPLVSAALSYIDKEVKRSGGKQIKLTEGAVEHEKYKDHTKNPYHEILTKHGFQHDSTKHKQNPFAKNNPRADSTVHQYTHPSHGKSSVTVEQEHDPTIGHGGMKSKGHGFLHRHEQENGLISPSSGDSKNQLHQSLSYMYGVPKGMEAPKLTASEKRYPHTAPNYKMNEGVLLEAIPYPQKSKHLKDYKVVTPKDDPNYSKEWKLEHPEGHKLTWNREANTFVHHTVGQPKPKTGKMVDLPVHLMKVHNKFDDQVKDYVARYGASIMDSMKLQHLMGALDYKVKKADYDGDREADAIRYKAMHSALVKIDSHHR